MNGRSRARKFPAGWKSQSCRALWCYGRSCWGNWGGKSKAEDCSKATWPFLGKSVMCWICDLLVYRRSRLMIHTENVALNFLKKNPLESIFCFPEAISSWHQFTSSFLIISGLRPWTACHVSPSVKKTSVCLSCGNFTGLITEAYFTWIHEKQILSLLGKAHFHPPLHKGVLKGWYVQVERKQLRTK